MGTRKVPFTRELYIEREDFMEDPPKKFFRLFQGTEVRLRYAYIVKCENVIKDASGNITELHCIYYPDTKSGTGTDTRKVKATLHWVSAINCIDAEVRLFENLFLKENPNSVEDGKEFTDYLNPESLKILPNCKLESTLQDANASERYQFERIGYFLY